jgi:hypothetical protein
MIALFSINSSRRRREKKIEPGQMEIIDRRARAFDKSQRAEGRCVPVRVAVSAWCVIGDQRSDIPFVRAHDRLVAGAIITGE